MRSLFLLSVLLGMTAAPSSAAAAAPGAPLRQRPRPTARPTATADTTSIVSAVAALRADLERILERPGWPDARWSVLAVSVDRGDTLFARRAHRPLAPASNLKLFTTAAALYYLGPEYRYSTYLLADGPVRDGTLFGDLILYGTGDPTLSGRFNHSEVAVWEGLAHDLARLGVTEVRGDLVGDASYFDGLETGVGWRTAYMDAWYAAPASALSFHDNVVTVQVRPAEEVGWRPVIDLVPGGRGIAIVNQATTVARGRSRIQVERAAYDGPIVIGGQIRQGHAGIWRRIPVADPARYAVATFAEVLRERGLEIAGEIRSVRRKTESAVTGRRVFAPALDGRRPVQVLAVHRSPPLIDILIVINEESHNFYAEMVLRTVGRIAVDEGSVNAGERAVRTLIERETTADSVALRIFDGSGLSVLNRASAHAIVTLLAHMARSPLGQSFWSTLPEAGGPGGLPRMHRSAAAGNLRAKTGTIRGVSALSGYVRAANDELLAFSIISNDVPSTWRAKRVEDAIGVRLAEFDRPRASPAASDARPVAHRIDLDSPPPRSRSAPRFHVVRRGDTLEEIARRYGTTVRAIEAANPGIEPRRLIPGHRVRLPGP